MPENFEKQALTNSETRKDIAYFTDITNKLADLRAHSKAEEEAHENRLKQLT